MIKIFGLSLCIQGTSFLNNSNLSGARFIPVHTGNMHQYQIELNDYAVYPCAYREHAPEKKQSMIMRRFIPVHTGNINTDRDRFCRGTVYPCAYREHITVYKIVERRDGLSLCIQGTYQL